MPIRITGLNSGLDTEAIISALVSSYNYKTQKYKKAQTKLSWKQDAWKTLNTKIYSLYNSVGNMRFSNAYNLKSTTVSDSTKATVTAGSSAPNGTQKLNIIQIAQAGYLTGAELDKSTTTGTTLAELGYTGGNGTINLTKGDGTTTQITVTQGTTVSSFISSLKSAGVNASYDDVNHRIYVSSEKTGADNDFTLTGANVDGANALYALGLNVESDATKATYQSYAKYVGATTADTQAAVSAALEAYRNALAAYEAASAQNANLSATYGYASAYTAMMDALNNTSLSDTEKTKLQTLLGMTAKERTTSIMDADGNVYSYATTDKDGNKIYSYKDESGATKYIEAVDTYTGSDGKTYSLNDDGTYTDGTNTYKATKEKDADGNVLYVNTADENDKITIEKSTAYYEAEATQQNTPYYKCVDADGNEYVQSETSNGYYVDTDGNRYRLNTSTNSLFQVDENGKDVNKNEWIKATSVTRIKETVYEQTTGTALADTGRASDVLTELKEASGLSANDYKTLTANVAAVNSYEAAEDTLDASDAYARANIVADIKNAYANNGTAGVTDLTNAYASAITANKETMATSQETMDEHSVLATIAAMEKDSAEEAQAIADFVTQAEAANNISSSVSYNTNAKKIDGQDAVIKLNGVTYTGDSNSFSINGLSITAQAETGDGDANAITITTSTDTQGIYDKIKDFLTQYNALINEITSLYNADSAKGYEPLTDEEKDSLSETEIEKWEEKIKASLLRRDNSLESVMNAMTSAMSKGVKIGDKTYYLSSFGINTLGYLNAPENEQNAYHIYGDEDDAATAGKDDKLMAAITADPDTVVEFMQNLATNLYNAVGDKMKSTTLSSVYTVYNDKEMASEYSDYTDLIKKWEEKLQKQEDYYYEKFSAMETALAKLNSQSSSLSSLLGG